MFSYPLTPTLYVPVKIREHKKTEIPAPIQKNPIKEKLIEKQKNGEPISKTNLTATTSKKNAKSHLIVGCFSSEINANQLINELKAKAKKEKAKAKAKAKKEKAKAKAKKEKQKAKAKKEKAKAKAKKVTCKKSTCSKKNKK